VKRLLFVLFAAPSCSRPHPQGTVEEKVLPGFGEVRSHRPRDLASAKGVVLFVSGDGG
jgi:hypothetical protein